MIHLTSAIIAAAVIALHITGLGAPSQLIGPLSDKKVSEIVPDYLDGPNQGLLQRRI
jgi:hypothetical protein